MRGHLGVAVPECIAVRFKHFISGHPGAACTEKAHNKCDDSELTQLSIKEKVSQ